MYNNMMIAKELLKCVKMIFGSSQNEEISKRIIAMPRFPYPKEGLYHNDDGNFDASVRNTEINEMNRKVKNEILHNGIPLCDYQQVLMHLDELFRHALYLMDEIPSGRNQRKHGTNNAYSSKLYGIVTHINGTAYKLHFTVLFPVTQSNKNYQPNSKIKLYHFTMKEI